ncbi:cytochrome P450-dit2 [Tilletia horrida]|uniref:Cytochrome P450-dit2 n=1 Tax=Tilletia horrida TaxID=155126 RepID=A0AAN6GEQ9_9BASI|nr:cytochrome P450-dit2 [Tilletia horrida]
MLAIFLFAVLAAYFAFVRLLCPPRSLAPGVPVVPLWVSLLPLFRALIPFGPGPIGQDVHFQRYLRPRLDGQGLRGGGTGSCGCVVIFFGGRWSLLFTHPAAVRALTSGTALDGDAEGLFPKSGNHIKIPRAVISALTGGNVISESGSAWSRFRSVIAPHLQRRADVDALSAAAARLVDRLAELGAQKAGAPLPVNDLVQRFTMQALLSSLFHQPIELFGKIPPKLHTLHSQVKMHIFDPFFLTFPALDQWPWSMLFRSRPRALLLIRALEREVIHTLAGRSLERPEMRSDETKEEEAEESEDLVISILDEAATLDPDQEKARPSPLMRSMLDATESGLWSARELIDNMKILFIAGHENTQQGLNSILWMLAKHQTWQTRLRSAIESLTDSTEHDAEQPIRRPVHQIDERMLDALASLRGFIYEALRLLPPIPQLINRRCRENCVLHLPIAATRTGGEEGRGDAPVPMVRVIIPAGTYVGWSAYGLHRSRFNTSWGDSTAESEAFRPERWGNTTRAIESTARRARERGELLTFHAGVRACLGQKFAMTKLMVAIIHILIAFEIRPLVDSSGKQAEVMMTPGGLLRPLELPVQFIPR